MTFWTIGPAIVWAYVAGGLFGYLAGRLLLYELRRPEQQSVRCLECESGRGCLQTPPCPGARR